MPRLYIHTGGNFYNGFAPYTVVEIKTINDWITYFFGADKIDFFKNDSEKEVVDYIKTNCQQTLKLYKRK